MPSTLTESSYIFTDKYSHGLYINGGEESEEDEGEGIMDPRYAFRLKIYNTFRIFIVLILLLGIIGLFTYILIKYVF